MREFRDADVAGVKIALAICTNLADRWWLLSLLSIHTQSQAEKRKPRIKFKVAPKQMWNKSWQYNVAFTVDDVRVDVIFFLTPSEWPTDDVIRTKVQSECYKRNLQYAHHILDAEVVRS